MSPFVMCWRITFVKRSCTHFPASSILRAMLSRCLFWLCSRSMMRHPTSFVGPPSSLAMPLVGEWKSKCSADDAKSDIDRPLRHCPHRAGVKRQGIGLIVLQTCYLEKLDKFHGSMVLRSCEPWMRNLARGRSLSFEISPAFLSPYPPRLRYRHCLHG